MQKTLTLLLAVLTMMSCSEHSTEDEENGANGNGSSSSNNLKAGLVAHYTFDDENGKDLSSNSYDAILLNSPSYITDTPNGKGKAVSLKGLEKQFINIPYRIFVGVEYSVSMWVKDFTHHAVFFSAVGGDRRNDFPCLRTTLDKTLNFYAQDRNYDLTPSKIKFSYLYNGDLQNGEWHLLTLVNTPITTYGTCLKELYVDGVLVDNIEGIYGVPNALKVHIGGEVDGHYNDNGVVPGDMKIDNVRFYSRALSKKEVNQILKLEQN